MSLTQTALKYGVSRASVIRFVRNAQADTNCEQFAVAEQPTAACVA